MYLITFELGYSFDSLVIYHPSPTNNIYIIVLFFLYIFFNLIVVFLVCFLPQYIIHLCWKQRTKEKSKTHLQQEKSSLSKAADPDKSKGYV